MNTLPEDFSADLFIALFNRLSPEEQEEMRKQITTRLKKVAQQHVDDIGAYLSKI